MKLKAFFLLPGLIALTLAVSPVIASFSPALADSTQTDGYGGRHEEHGRGDRFENLNLTDAQKAQAKQIFESSRQQEAAVFTADQQAQLATARANHTRPNITLSPDQKSQLKAIHESARSQFEAILTSEQLQQLKNQHHSNDNSDQSH